MNSVFLIGRLTKDAEVRIGTGNGMTVAKITLAVERLSKDKEKTADFINCVAFGKTAEVLEMYTGKGKMLAVQGRIQTGSYEKDGKKVYKTEVVVDKIKLIEPAAPADDKSGAKEKAPEEKQESFSGGFAEADLDDVPF